jgi:transcriptional regulator with XRE-family HTH domain
MKLGQKIRSLRAVEGPLRGLGRAMTQTEVVRAMKKELGETVSQSYLSQIEGGARPHLTEKTRELLSRFFRVYPGFLVADPEGFHSELASELRVREDRLDSWLLSGIEKFRGDAELCRALKTLVDEPDSRRALLLLEQILRNPEMTEQLGEVLLRRKGHAMSGSHEADVR